MKRGHKYPSRLVEGSDAHQVWCALKNGAETVADVEADLNFRLSRHLIAGHLSNLKKRGWARVVGTAVVYRQDGRTGHCAHRYAAQQRELPS